MSFENDKPKTDQIVGNSSLSEKLHRNSGPGKADDPRNQIKQARQQESLGRDEVSDREHIAAREQRGFDRIMGKAKAERDEIQASSTQPEASQAETPTSSQIDSGQSSSPEAISAAGSYSPATSRASNPTDDSDIKHETNFKAQGQEQAAQMTPADKEKRRKEYGASVNHINRQEIQAKKATAAGSPLAAARARRGEGQAETSQQQTKDSSSVQSGTGTDFQAQAHDNVSTKTAARRRQEAIDYGNTASQLTRDNLAAEKSGSFSSPSKIEVGRSGARAAGADAAARMRADESFDMPESPRAGGDSAGDTASAQTAAAAASAGKGSSAELPKADDQKFGSTQQPSTGPTQGPAAGAENPSRKLPPVRR